MFWLDRGRHRASVELCSRSLRDNAAGLEEFALSENILLIVPFWHIMLFLLGLINHQFFMVSID